MVVATTCRQEILVASAALMARTGRGEFALGDLVAEMRRAGTRYSDSSIRTHVGSFMCVNAPRNFAVTHPDFERVGHGLYRPYRPVGSQPVLIAPRQPAVQPQPPTSVSQQPSPAPVSRPLGKVARRMRERVDGLITGFSGYLTAFAASDSFTGPSVYFHLRTLELLRAHASPVEALSDQQYLDYAYATLVSWGMHRMGRGGAKLRSMDDLRSGFQAQWSKIAMIQRLELLRLGEDEVADVADHLWSIIDALTVGVGATKIVSGSKALHHLIPALVPPIDRQYTLRFFYGSTMFSTDDQGQMVKTLFPLFREIAMACDGPIADALAHPTSPMDNSVTKVIDNAIIGYCIRELADSPDLEHPV